VHIVEGMHRIAALECALVGYQNTRIDNKDDKIGRLTYLQNLPHAEKKINIQAILPNKGELENETFLTDMRLLLAKAQAAVGKVQPHGKKIFYTQADRGCAVVAFWGGGKGAYGIGCYAPRATDFREERNPPQAKTILIERKLCTIRTILQYYHCNTVHTILLIKAWLCLSVCLSVCLSFCVLQT
jgi:hypothetical protein